MKWANRDPVCFHAHMRTSVEFLTDALSDGEPDDLHPEGEALARFLAANLARHGLQPGSVIMEDWGWVVQVRNLPVPAWIGCGFVGGEVNRLLCFIEPNKRFVWRWFQRRDAGPTIERIADAIDAILRETTGISEIQWSDERRR